MVIRETPKRRTRSVSLGRRVPGPYSPERMLSLRLSKMTRYFGPPAEPSTSRVSLVFFSRSIALFIEQVIPLFSEVPMRVLTLGEVLWDVIRDQEFLGGAPLNFSVSLHRLGHDVTFASGVGADERGNRALRAVHHLGLSTKFIRINRQLPTRTAVVLENPAGNATFRIDRPAAFDVGDDDPALLSRLEQSQPDWIYFGTLAQTSPEGEARLFRITDAVPQARCFYDMNLRQGHWNLELVRRLSRRATILKLNDGE